MDLKGHVWVEFEPGPVPGTLQPKVYIVDDGGKRLAGFAPPPIGAGKGFGFGPIIFPIAITETVQPGAPRSEALTAAQAAAQLGAKK